MGNNSSQGRECHLLAENLLKKGNVVALFGKYIW